jgi:nitroreductase
MSPWSRRRFIAGLAGAGALPLALAGASAAPGDTGCWVDLVNRRRMVRRFKPDPVSPAALERLLRAANRAPSAGNTQPWAFVVVRDSDRRTALARAALGQMFVATAPVVVVACADPSRARQRYGERAERYAMIDTAFASMCLLLSATAEGLGACFVGALDDAEVRRVLQAPLAIEPLAVIPIGYPAESPRAQPLRPLDEAVHQERW